MKTLSPEQLLVVAGAITGAYPGTGQAIELFASINENFEANTDDSLDLRTRIHDAIADLDARGRLLALISAALADAHQQYNAALRQALQPWAQQTRWQLLDTAGLVLRMGPFVNRRNLRDSVAKLFLSRRVLRIISNGNFRGKSWSCQLIEHEAFLRGARFIPIDLRNAPLAGRVDPSWMATKLHQNLFVETAQPSIVGIAESRLIEPLLKAWIPPAAPVLVTIDHLGDANIAPAVREYVTALALAVAEGKLTGLRLVLIDGPPGLDLSRYLLYTADDVVGVVTAEHVSEFFQNVASSFFPHLAPSELRKLVDTAVDPLRAKLPAGADENLAIAIRDTLEELAMT